VKAALASFDQTNFSEALSSLKKGRPFSPSREIKRFKMAMLLDILDVFGRLHIQNGLFLCQIGAYAVVADDIAQ
jgi:hypothetical protein